MTESSDQRMFLHAYNGDLAECKRLADLGTDVVMALMGATPRDKKDETQELRNRRREICDWALNRGAPLLFGINQTGSRIIYDGDNFFSRVSMRRGPGDIAKGSFS